MHEAVVAARSGGLLTSGIVVTTPDGHARAAELAPEHRALLEQRDLLGPAGRIRVERLIARPVVGEADVVRSIPLFSDHALLGWLVVATLDGGGPDLAAVAALAETLTGLMTA